MNWKEYLMDRNKIPTYMWLSGAFAGISLKLFEVLVIGNTQSHSDIATIMTGSLVILLICFHIAYKRGETK